MKKGLLLTLMLVTIALLCTSAYGSTINISSIPDVIIGDAEQNLTIDNNFFIYTGVFNFDDEVSFSPTDYPSSKPDVKWSFIEYASEADYNSATPASSSWITINDEDPYTGSYWDPTTGELRSAAVSGSRADFRNIQLSPTPDNLPYDDPTTDPLDELAPRWIDLIAAYAGTTSDTETIIVYALDDGNDSFSDAPIWTDDFEPTNDWTWSDLAAYYATEFPAPTSLYEETSTGNGDYAVGMESSDTTADSQWQTGTAGFMAYGSWLSPSSPMPIPVTMGKLYKARWSLVGDQTTALDTCGWRGLWRTGHGASSAGYHQVNDPSQATHPSTISTDPNSPSDFEMYFYPPQDVQQYVKDNLAAQDGLALAVDMTDGRPAAVGKILVSEVSVYEYDPPAAVTATYSAPPFGTAGDFLVIEWDELNSLSADPSTVVVGVNDSTGVSVNFPARSGSGFRMGLVSQVNTGQAITAGKLYRLKLNVTSGASDTNMSQCRIRLYTTLGDQGADIALNPSDFSGAASTKTYALPGTTGMELVNYLKVDNFRSGDDMNFALDFYGGSTGGDDMNCTWGVTSVSLEEVVAP